MKRLIILILLVGVLLVACNSSKEETEETKEQVETEEETDKKKKDSIAQSKDESVKEKEPTEENKKDSDEKSTSEINKTSKNEFDEKPIVKNEKVEVTAEKIIWAQNNRDYKELESYLGQNITLNKNNNTLKITNVDYPHEAKLLIGIEKENLEHRFTHDSGQDTIVGFAVIDQEKEMSYTIDLTMRVGKDSWKVLNMQINK